MSPTSSLRWTDGQTYCVSCGGFCIAKVVCSEIVHEKITWRHHHKECGTGLVVEVVILAVVVVVVAVVILVSLVVVVGDDGDSSGDVW